MPNLAATLKEEIRRLARREIKTQTQQTKRATAQHRREIIRLRRLLKLQEKKLAALESRQQAAAPAEAVEETGPGPRFSPRSVRAQRRRLRLTGEEFAKLLGVAPQTVYHWEQGKSRPRQAQLEALAAVRSLGRREARQRLEE